jgi:hypothetical protein
MPTAIECQFIEIQGDKSLVSIIMHNEHNGDYVGISLDVRELAHAE